MSETKRNLSDFFVEEKLRGQQKSQLQQARFVRESRKDPETDGSNIVQAREGFADYFSAGLQIGRSQLESDLKRFQAMGNLFIGDDKAAAYRLSEARIIDGYNDGLFEELEPFSDLLENPNFDSLSEQAGKAIGQFAPLALTSIASGLTGAAVSVLGRGAFTASSRAGMKELFSGALKKKSLNQTLSPEEKLILETSRSIGRFGVRGGIGGAFTQEQVIGSAQALAEFEDAGKEITRDEAFAAQALGIPQAVLGTVSEGLFAASLFKLAFRKSPLGLAQQKQKLGKKLDAQEQLLIDLAEKRAKGEFLTKAQDKIYRDSVNPGSYFGNVMKDVANATAASATAESITELGQEEILIQQRKAIDPEYANQEANLRRAESAFAGFFAGGARSGATAPISSVFKTARQKLQQVRDDKAYGALREEQYGPVSGMPIPETKKQLEAQIQQFKDGKKDAIYVSEGMEFSNDMLKEAGITDVDSITVPGIGTFITNNPEKFSKLLTAQAENNLLNNAFLADFLGYSNVGTATDDIVVTVVDPKTGEIIEQQTTDIEGQELAIRNFRERYGEDAVIETQILDDAVKSKKSKNDVEVRQEGGTIDEDLDDIERAQFTAEGRMDEFGQELGIEEAFDLSTAEGGTSYILVGPEKGKRTGEKNRFGKVIGDPDSFNLIDPETEANYGAEQRTKLREKRNRVIADIEGRDFESTRTVFGQEVPTGSAIDEGADLRPDLAFINQLGDGPLDKYLKFVERNPNVDIQFELGADNKVRLRIQAQPGVGSGIVATEEEAVRRALRAARISAFVDDNKTTGFNSETKDFKWFLDIPGARNEDRSNNNTNQKPINMNKLLQEAQKIWSADMDAGTKSGLNYRQQLALGFGQIFATLSDLKNNEGNPITLNYLDKNTGEVFNLSGMASTDTNAVSRVPIYFDFKDKKYYTLTELSKSEVSPIKSIKESILSLAGRILAVTSFEEGSKTTFEYNYNDILRAMIGPEAAKDFIEVLGTLTKAQFETFLNNFLREPTPQAARATLRTYDAEGLIEELAIDSEQALFNLEDFATQAGVYTNTPRFTAEALNDMPGVGGSNEFAIGQIEGFLRQGLHLNRTTFELSDNEIAYQQQVARMEQDRPNRAESPLDRVERRKLARQETRRVDIEGVRVSNNVAQMFNEEGEGTFETRIREGQFIKEPTLIRGLKGVVKDLGLNRDTVVIASNETDLTIGLEGTYTTPNDAEGKSPNQISGIGGINAFIRRQQEEVENDTNPNNFARIIQFADKDVIILKSYQADELSGGNPTAQAVERRTIALGHEFGHSFLFQELDRLKDTPVFKKVEDAFNKIIDAGDAPAAYLGKYGFEEFFADQFGLASIQRLNNIKANDAVSSFFHRIVKRMETFFGSLTGALEKRYGQGVTAEFNDFMQQVRTKYLSNATNPNNGSGTKAEIQVRNAIFEVTEKAGKWLGGKKTINKLNKFVNEAMSTVDNTSIAEKSWWGLKYIFLPSHNYLAQQQKRTSDATSKKVIQDLADQTYIASKEKGRGYVNSHPNARAEKINELLSLSELGIEDPLRPTATEMERLETIFLEVEKNPRDREAGELTTAVTAVENFLNKFWNDVLKENNIPFRENYFPRALDLAVLMGDPNKQKALADLLARANPGQGVDFNKIVAEIVKDESDATLDNFNVETDEAVSDIAVGSNRLRAEYFKNLSNSELREIGVLLPSVTSMFEYIDASVKRVEFNKNYTYKLSDLSPEAASVLAERDITFSEKATLEGTPDGTLVGWKAIEAQLAEIKDPKIRREVRNTMKSMLGKSDITMSPFARNLNSFFLTLNVVTYLTFAPLASFPDLAGPILFSGDYKALTQDLVKTLGDLSTKEGRKRLEKLSLDVGVNSASALHQFYINAAEQNYVGPTAKRAQDIFFKYTGLEGFTRFTRYYAAGMAQSFLIRAAEGARQGDSVLAKQLSSLGVTPEQVEAWQKDGGDFSLHPEIKKAHAQFVDESIVRPNSAERPAWASSPYFALVWQLKSFFYAYGKNIMMGLYRTARLRGKEAGLTSMSAPLILGAVTLLPLTMVGLELRELIKYLAGGGDASKLRTNEMDWPDYSFEILDRSGALGPFGLLIPALEAERYGDEFWISPLGPTAERFEDLIQGDFKLKDLTPVLSSL